MPSQRFKGFTVFKGLEGFKRLECLAGLEGFKGLEGLRAGKRQGFTVVKGLEGFKRLEGLEGLRVWSVLGRANGRLGRPEEAIDVWPWGACWLQEWPYEAIDVWRGVAVGCKMKDAKSKF